MLSDEQRETLAREWCSADNLAMYGKPTLGFDNIGDYRIAVVSLLPAVERIASDAARAAESALVERLSKLADEWEQDAAQQKDRAARAAGDRRQPYLTNAAFYETHARRVRTALRPEAATTEGAEVEPGGPVHVHGYAGEVCDICGWDGLAARPSSTPEGDAPAAVHPDTEGAECAPSAGCPCPCHRPGGLTVTHVTPCCPGRAARGEGEPT